MMTRNEFKTNSKRHPYQKPKLEQVQLVAGEVVLAACKGAGFVGPKRPAGSACVHPSQGDCVSIGNS
jgi:hypothetical protein